MEPPTTIDTHRLTLRRTTIEDAESAFAYASDAEVTRCLTITPRQSVDDVVEFLKRCNESWDSGSSFPLAITIKSDGTLIGMIAPRISEHGVELGHVLRRDAWGRGFMTEAIHAVIDWAFGNSEVHRVWAYTDVTDASSQRVLEKVGMTKEGTLHRWQVHPNLSSHPSDAHMYAVWR